MHSITINNPNYATLIIIFISSSLNKSDGYMSIMWHVYVSRVIYQKNLEQISYNYEVCYDKCEKKNN
jgi:hypothetical protein